MNNNEHVLIVGDDQNICTIVREYLEAEGYRVSVARNGEEIHRVIGAAGINLVLLDLVLPGEDGLVLARALRSENADIGIIMPTGRGETVDRIIGLELGADDYIAKPFHLRELLARIKSVSRGLPPATEETPAGDKQIHFAGWCLDLARRDHRTLCHRPGDDQRDFVELCSNASSRHCCPATSSSWTTFGRTRTQKSGQLIEAAGAELRFLPAYSPDLNPIEHSLRQAQSPSAQGQERSIDALWQCTGQLLDLLRQLHRQHQGHPPNRPWGVFFHYVCIRSEAHVFAPHDSQEGRQGPSLLGLVVRSVAHLRLANTFTGEQWATGVRRYHQTADDRVRSAFPRAARLDNRLRLFERRQEIGHLPFLHLLQRVLQSLGDGVELIGLWFVRDFPDSRIDGLDGCLQGLGERALLHIDNRLLHTRQGFGDLVAGVRRSRVFHLPRLRRPIR
jgi:CheY-like chemotaxis protein